MRHELTTTEQAGNELSSLVYRISSEPIREIDRLIEGLNDLRKQLDGNGRRVQHDIAVHTTFSQSVSQLTKIVSEGMACNGSRPSSAIK